MFRKKRSFVQTYIRKHTGRHIQDVTHGYTAQPGYYQGPHHKNGRNWKHGHVTHPVYIGNSGTNGTHGYAIHGYSGKHDYHGHNGKQRYATHTGYPGKNDYHGHNNGKQGYATPTGYHDYYGHPTKQGHSGHKELCPVIRAPRMSRILECAYRHPEVRTYNADHPHGL